jgi:succinate dehydrogenase / fumarate reductase cytochrome b subunit
MARFSELYRSAVGKKALMAVTGIVLFGFVLVHMIGNLKLYMGAEHLNEYGHWLRVVGAPAVPETGALWIARIVLLACVGLHMMAATQLTLMNRRARPERYKIRQNQQADYASRTMRWGGVIIALFVLFHLGHFTWGSGWAWGFTEARFVPGDVYHNVVSGFQVWWVSAFYIAAQVALGFHLYHGVWSMFQSLGAERNSQAAWRRKFAVVFALVISIGNISFPLAVLTGVVR